MQYFIVQSSLSALAGDWGYLYFPYDYTLKDGDFRFLFEVQMNNKYL